ncbi:MAG: nucleotidyl transferase [Proteobacteria bacterium]|nr:MAG: nucleotidyl transferase [Pseudomonadota bacterium]
MGRATENAPKCLLEIAGRTLLDWQIAALRRAGIEQIAIVRGYRADSVTGPHLLLENSRWESTNMVRSLEQASDLLARGLCIVVYSDIAFHPEIITRLLGSDHEIAIAVDTRWRELWTLRFENPLADAETLRLENGRVADIGARPRSYADVEAQYIGLTRLTPNGWNALRLALATLPPADVDRLDITSLLRLAISRGQQVAAVPIEGRWCEVDSETDLASYARLTSRMSGELWSHDWRW